MMKNGRIWDNLKALGEIITWLVTAVLVLLTGLIWYLLYGAVTAETPISERMRDPSCEFVTAFDAFVGDHRLQLEAPTIKTVRFSYDPNALANYVTSVATPAGFGFCKDFVWEDRTIESIEVNVTQSKRIAVELGLPFPEDVRRLSVGTRGFSGWMRIPKDSVPNGNSALLMKNENFGFSNDGLTSEFLFSEGWIENRYRLSSWCSWRSSDTKYSCSFRIETRKDGLIYEVYGLSVEERPKPGSAPPDYVSQIAQTLPNLLNHLSYETTR